MAETLGKLQIDLEARLAKFESDMGRAARLLQRDMVQASQRAERQMRQMRQSMERDMERVRNQARNVAAAVVGIFSVQQGARFARDLARVADGYANVQAKLRLVTADQNQLGRVSQQVFGIAQRTYSSLDSTATLVSRTTQALVSNGAAADQALTRSLALTETIQQAFAVSGATTQEASNAIIQLSQGLAAGALRGEEFNSIAEQGPRIMKALADSLGVTTGELRKMAQEGKLTAEVIEGALSGQAETIAAEFAQLPLTIERAMVQLRNEFTRFVGEADQASGASRRVAESIQAIARNLPAIISGFVTLAKVATAYFAVYRVAIPLLAAVRAAHAAWVQQVIAGNLAMQMGIATAVSWQATMTKVFKGVAALAVSAFAGYQFGTWLRDNFLEAELAGIALVNGLLTAWERMKQFSARIWEEIKFQAMNSLNAIRVALADALDFYANAASTADIFGIGEGAIGKIRQLATALRPTTSAADDFAAAVTRINEETERNIAQIDEITSDLADQAIAQREVAEAATSAAGATGDFNVNLAEAGTVASSSQQMFDDCAVALATLNDQWKAGQKDARRWTREIEQQQDAVRQLVADLEMELQMVGMTNLERQIAIATRQAEAAGMGDQIDKIRGLYTELDRMRQLDAVAHDLARAFGDFAVEALTNFDDLGETIDDFFDSLGDMAKRAVAQMIAEFARLEIINPILNRAFGGNLATGGSQLGGLFGGGSGGFGGGAFGSTLGLVAGAATGDPLAGALGGFGFASSTFGATAIGSGLSSLGITAGLGVAVPIVGALIGAALSSVLGDLLGGEDFDDPRLRVVSSGNIGRNVQRGSSGLGTFIVNAEQRRDGADIERQLVEALGAFDASFMQLVEAFGVGEEEMTRLREAAQAWSFDMRGAAVSAEDVLGSRFTALVNTFGEDVAAFAAQAEGLEEQFALLGDALFIRAAAEAGRVGDTFDQVRDVLERFRIEGEALDQTYARVAASTMLLEEALEYAGVSLDIGRDAFITLANEIVEAAGGLQQAQSLWADFFQSFYTDAERAERQVEQAARNATHELADIGLSLEDFAGSQGMADFRALFESVLPDLTADQVVAWLEAARALGVLNSAIEEFAQFAEATSQALASGSRPGGGAVFDPNAGIQPGDVGVQEPGIYYPGYMSPADLAAQRQVLEQAMRAAEEQQNAAADSADTVSESVDRLSNALERWIETLDELQRDLLTDETLSVLTPAERLAEVERQYQEAFTGALAGDQASRDLFDQIARQFAEVGRDFFGSSEGYTDIFTRILADIGLLRSTAGAPATSSPALDNLIGGTSGGTGASASDPRTDAIVARLETVENLLRNIVTSSNRTANATEQTALNTEMQQERTYG